MQRLFGSNSIQPDGMRVWSNNPAAALSGPSPQKAHGSLHKTDAARTAAAHTPQLPHANYTQSTPHTRTDTHRHKHTNNTVPAYAPMAQAERVPLRLPPLRPMHSTSPTAPKTHGRFTGHHTTRVCTHGMPRHPASLAAEARCQAQQVAPHSLFLELACCSTTLGGLLQPSCSTQLWESKAHENTPVPCI